MCAIMRAVKAIDGPSLLNDNFSPFPSFFINWMDAPWTTMGTFVTAYLWLRIVFDIKSKVAQLNIAVCVLLLCMYVYLQYLALAFTVTVFEPTYAPQFATTTELFQWASRPIFIVNISFLAIFVMSVVVAIQKIVRTGLEYGNASMIATMRKLIGWIVLQIVGNIVYVIGFYIDANHTSVEENFPISDAFLMRHSQLVGTALASTGQVGAVYMSNRTSSSSSSSSSSTSGKTQLSSIQGLSA